MTKKFINMLGLTEVSPKGREISYEELTQAFDGRGDLDAMMNLVIYHFNVIRSDVKNRESESGVREPMSELEIKKLSFLYRMSVSLKSLGVESQSKDLTQLKVMTWLEGEI